jgi:putative FmdB family regulatory protein
MPTYEYRCPGCGHQFEKFQRMSDPPVANCPECSASAERRLSGGAGFLFKGSGFYITDYRSDSYRNAAKAESGGGEAKAEKTPGGESTSGSKAAGAGGSPASGASGSTSGGSGSSAKSD